MKCEDGSLGHDPRKSIRVLQVTTFPIPMHWLTINPMKITKAFVSVHQGSELPKPSMEEVEEKIEGPGKSSEGACVGQVKFI